MVLSMSSKGPDQKESAGFGNDSDDSESELACGSFVSETAEVLEKVEPSQREQRFIKEALSFFGNSDAKWFDARGQSGPSPSDFGDHDPIPVDAVCASIVISEEED